jgi:hypothetical protein
MSRAPQSFLIRTVRLILLGILALTEGCDSTTSSATSNSDSESAGAGGGAPIIDADTRAETVVITFNDDSKNPIFALSRHSLEIVVVPPSSYPIDLALVGDSLDASLDKSTITTSKTGRGTVRVTAPSKPTTFSIRATVDGSLSTEFNLAVVENSTGNATVNFDYSGTRTPTKYVLSLYPSTFCNSITATTAPIRQLEVLPSGFPVTLKDVPMEDSLAVKLDGDQLTSGCSMVSKTTGVQDFTVRVPLENLPVVLKDAKLDVAISPSSDGAVLMNELRVLGEKLLVAYQANSHDLIALLDEMGNSALSATKAEFVSVRASSSWDTQVKSDYASVGGESLLRSQLNEMFSPTISNIGASHAFELSLSLQPSAQQSPFVTYVRIAGLNPETFVDSIQWSLSRNVDAYDRLSWSTDIRYLPAKMLQFAIDNFRIKNVTTATNTYEAIATRFDCNGFAKKLDNTAVWSESTSRTCSVDCLTNLCRNALVIMYDPRHRDPRAYRSGHPQS